MRSTSCLLVVAILAGCTREEPATEPPHEVSVTAPSPESLRQATYSGIYEQPVELDAGLYRGEPFVPGGSSRPTVSLLPEPMLFADLDGDGVDEGFALLVEDSGGSGAFIFLAVMEMHDGVAINLATTLVGDRVRVIDLAVSDELLTASFKERLPNPAGPATHRRSWRLADDALVEEKIALHLDALDESGLIGPADGKRALSYEFCVPNDEGTLAEVSAIDPSAQAQGQSPGRVGCTADQVLFIGNTHQPGFREILERLAERSDITRIEPAYFE